jgi:hypothetical protein
MSLGAARISTASKPPRRSHTSAILEGINSTPCGAVLDREHGILDARERAEVRPVVDTGYQGSGPTVAVPQRHRRLDPEAEDRPRSSWGRLSWPTPPASCGQP